MKYLLVALLLASIAGLEFYHEFSADDAPDALVCSAPQAQADSVRDMLLFHLGSH